MRKSSTFYRLVKKDEFGKYDVYDFHTVINGNMYFQQIENADLDEDGLIIGCCYHNKPKFTNKEEGNKKYRALQAKGFKALGKFEMDVCGNTRRI